jgi:hypothetical protein
MRVNGRDWYSSDITPEQAVERSAPMCTFNGCQARATMVVRQRGSKSGRKLCDLHVIDVLAATRRFNYQGIYVEPIR